MNRLGLALLCGLCGALGCGKEGGGGGGGGGLATEARSLELGALAVDLKVPTGWTEAKLGATTVTYTRPGGMYNSVLMISSTCAGDCSTVADNLGKFAAEQVKMHEGSYDTVEIEKDAAIDGGHEIALELVKGGQTSRQYVVLRHQPGWAEAAQCSILAMNDDVARFDDLAGLCRALTAKPGA